VTTWVELSVASLHPEFAEEALLSCGAASVTMIDAADVPVLEPAPGETPLWPATITTGLFLAGSDLDAVRAQLAELLPDGDSAPITVRAVEDRDWVRAWLDHAEPLPFGLAQPPRLWIEPTGCAVPEAARASATIVVLDPGLAFGTGTHPSTAMCLDWLADHEIAGQSVLDYGCGSGVLAIAALKLGAASAHGVDLDPQALVASEDNARGNDVSERLTIAGIEAPLAAAYDLVLANILARPLIELAAKLAAVTRPGGRIVLAGLLERQADEVRAAYSPWFAFDEDGRRDGWNRVSGTRIR
jgi:ribosomal protein L11 methyltransferase